MTRSEARESLFLLLFEATFFGAPDLVQIKQLAGEYRNVETNEYVDTALDAILADIDGIDAGIDPFLEKVSSNRVSRVARTAMRIAVFEIRGGDTPVPVAINEAVDLVKKYDTDEVAKYVNGVLGSYVRSLS